MRRRSDHISDALGKVILTLFHLFFFLHDAAEVFFSCIRHSGRLLTRNKKTGMLEVYQLIKVCKIGCSFRECPQMVGILYKPFGG